MLQVLKSFFIFVILISWLEVNCTNYNFKITEFDSQDPAILISDSLPYINGTLENKLLPYVGNGHLASTIFDKSVFLNGLYNGKHGESHRANLPNIHNFFFNSPDILFKMRQYVLHLKNGIN